MRKTLSRKFYFQNTPTVAKELLGCFLIREYRGKIWRGMITETEAYVGEKDLACHASRGRTSRTEVMYGQPGHAYVYMIYGMYHCLNIVTEKKDFPAAVLVRAVRIDGIEYKKTNGPGKLCKFLHIDRKLNKWDLTEGKKLWLERPAKNTAKRNITAGRRIGIDYAQHCREYLWRFSLKM
ncbi:MAG: 3-methyladenine DNA glycosylase [Candidatus Moranbacteria bacterium RBG_13_45_13]|nr:MAG: 3-methyladenine DNA glycosylase [Candidatus Moranbacteria bacterium RBG_13_45_13]